MCKITMEGLSVQPSPHMPCGLAVLFFYILKLLFSQKILKLTGNSFISLSLFSLSLSYFLPLISLSSLSLSLFPVLSVQPSPHMPCGLAVLFFYILKLLFSQKILKLTGNSFISLSLSYFRCLISLSVSLSFSHHTRTHL